MRFRLIDATFLRLAVEAGAPCGETDPEVFFPPSEANYERDAERAKAVCRRCPVVQACLFWALEVDDRFAVLGCTTPRERMRMVRASQRKSGKVAA